MACDATGPSPNCTANDSFGGGKDGIGILSGFSSGTGYDEATGLGSLNVANVVNAWPAVTGAATAIVTVTPAQTSINSNQSLVVTGTVASSTTGGTTPTGTVTISGGGLNPTLSATLSNTGSYSFTIPANSLTGGTDTLKVSYAGDVNYAAATGTANVTVTVLALVTPTVTVSPASTTLNSGSSLSVPVTVSGTGGTPTGTVTLTSGSYNSGAQTLVNGAYTFTIPANSLSTGADTLTVTYSGGGDYGSATGTATVTVTESTFSLNTTAIAVTPTGGVAPGGSANAAVTISDVAGYTGTVTLTCQLTNFLAGGTDAPTCSGGGSSLPVTLPNNTTQVINFTVSTTAASTTTLAMADPKPGSKHNGWTGAGGGAVLAFLVFMGIPARRRSWRAMLGALVLLVALGSLSSCGGGGGSGTTTNTDPGTSAGTYTFTVTATGNPSVAPAVSATFTVTVN
jgi:hypothetical protein